MNRILLVIIVSLSNAFAGILDPTFDPGTGAGGGIIEQALPLPSGKILVCGNFTSFNGRPKAYLARLNNDGSVDESFTANPGYWVRNTAVQPDGKIIIGGYFTTVQGVPRNRIARLNADGSLDPTFNPGSGMTNIIAGGIDGNIDPFVFWVALQPDGKILATGNFRNYDGASSTGIVRINPDGSRDTTFSVGGGLDSWGRHITVMPSGQILVSGWMTSYNGRSFNRIARINPDGSPDATFVPFFGDRTAIYCTALVGDGRMIATGHSLNYERLFNREMARLNANGTIDETFVGFTNEKTESAVIQSDGKVIVGGNFSRANNALRAKLARFKADGTLDDFSTSIDNFVWSVALQSDGKLLIAGGFTRVEGAPRVGVARLLTGAAGGTPIADTAPVLSVTGATTTSLTLSWVDTSTVRTGYVLEQKIWNGTFQQVAVLGSGARGYTASGLTAGTGYVFRLRASNSGGGVLYSNEASGTTSAGPGGTTQNRVVFAGVDTSTGGTWKGKYGADGYYVFGDSSKPASYVTLTPSGKSDWTWQWSTQNPVALQRASGADRLAACWYGTTGYTIDLNFTDTQLHRTAIYFLDWDFAGRNQVVRVLDGDSGAVLDSRTVSNFGNGVYLLWDLAGHVKISITPNNVNAVSSGIFFGGGGTVQIETVATPTISPNGGTFVGSQMVTLATSTAGSQLRYTTDGSEPTEGSTLYQGAFMVSTSSTVKARGFAAGMNPSATASASLVIQSSGGGSPGEAVFIARDTSTGGNWKRFYGSEGYNVIGKQQLLPNYAQVTPVAKNDWIWTDSTSDTRALLWPSEGGRIAACWYSSTAFELNINLTDGRTHRVAVYLCDWDNNGRAQTVEVINAANGAVLNSQSVTAFSGGQYLIWDIKGQVRLRFTRSTGANAVMSGLFFGPAATEL